MASATTRSLTVVRLPEDENLSILEKDEWRDIADEARRLNGEPPYTDEGFDRAWNGYVEWMKKLKIN